MTGTLLVSILAGVLFGFFLGVIKRLSLISEPDHVWVVFQVQWGTVGVFFNEEDAKQVAYQLSDSGVYTLYKKDMYSYSNNGTMDEFFVMKSVLYKCLEQHYGNELRSRK